MIIELDRGKKAATPKIGEYFCGEIDSDTYSIAH